LIAGSLQSILHGYRPRLQLLQAHVGAAYEAQLRLCVRIFPHNGISGLYAFQLRVIDHIDLRAFCDQSRTLLFGFGSQVFNVIQANSAVGCSGCAKLLQVGAGLVGQLGAQPLVHAGNKGHILHDLHADGRA